MSGRTGCRLGCGGVNSGMTGTAGTGRGTHRKLAATVNSQAPRVLSTGISGIEGLMADITLFVAADVAPRKQPIQSERRTSTLGLGWGPLV